MVARFKYGDSTGLDKYSEKALARVWKGQRFSLWMTTMPHVFSVSIVYDQKLQDTDLGYLFSSEKALGSLAKNFGGSAVLSGGGPAVECCPALHGGNRSFFLRLKCSAAALSGTWMGVVNADVRVIHLRHGRYAHRRWHCFATRRYELQLTALGGIE